MQFILDFSIFEKSLYWPKQKGVFMKSWFYILTIFISFQSFGSHEAAQSIKKEIEAIEGPMASLGLESWEVAYINISLYRKNNRPANQKEIKEEVMSFLRNEKTKIVSNDDQNLKILTENMAEISKKIPQVLSGFPMTSDELAKLPPSQQEAAKNMKSKMIDDARKTKATAGNHSSVFEQMGETLQYAKKIGFDENDVVRIIRDVNKNVKADKQNSSIDFEAVINGYTAEKNLNISTEEKKSLSRQLADIASYAKPKAAEVKDQMLKDAPKNIRNTHSSGSR